MVQTCLTQFFFFRSEAFLASCASPSRGARPEAGKRKKKRASCQKPVDVHTLFSTADSLWCDKNNVILWELIQELFHGRTLSGVGVEILCRDNVTNWIKNHHIVSNFPGTMFHTVDLNWWNAHSTFILSPFCTHLKLYLPWKMTITHYQRPQKHRNCARCFEWKSPRFKMITLGM